MLDLVRFELKKLLVRRTSLIACAGILVMLCGIMTLNIVQTKTASDTGEVLNGTAAIAHQKEKAAAHEGVLTVERVQDEVVAYQALAFSKVDPADVAGLSDEAAYALMIQAYDEDEFRAIYDSYYAYLLSPWRRSLTTAPPTGSTKPSRASYSARSTTTWAVRGRIPMPSARTGRRSRAG